MKRAAILHQGKHVKRKSLVIYIGHYNLELMTKSQKIRMCWIKIATWNPCGMKRIYSMNR